MYSPSTHTSASLVSVTISSTLAGALRPAPPPWAQASARLDASTHALARAIARPTRGRADSLHADAERMGTIDAEAYQGESRKARLLQPAPERAGVDASTHPEHDAAVRCDPGELDRVDADHGL